MEANVETSKGNVETSTYHLENTPFTQNGEGIAKESISSGYKNSVGENFSAEFPKFPVECPTEIIRYLKVSQSFLEKHSNVPAHIEVKPSTIPQALKVIPQWVVWKYELRDGDKWTKPPYNAKTDRKGKSNNPATWSTFNTAITAYNRGGYAGVGFVFNEGDGLVGVDLDHCYDSTIGITETWASEILMSFKGLYIELSPSGKGFRIFLRGKAIRCGKGTSK
ncbi:hypothetical protein CCP3SC5AM1_1940001 [Gammaproteobacteria bacterium]